MSCVTLGLGALLALAPSPEEPPPFGPQRRAPALYRESGPVYSMWAAPRLGILLVGGADVMQPVGFGAGIGFRVHALRVGPARFGLGIDFGHTQYIDRRDISFEGDNVRRYASLGHTDLSAGPSIQIVTGPVFTRLGFGAGLGISSFVRPLGPFTTDEQDFDDYTAVIRGGGDIGIPIRNGSSITVGAAVHKYFSDLQVEANPPLVDSGLEPGEPDTNPFDLMVEVTIGYHFSF